MLFCRALRVANSSIRVAVTRTIETPLYFIRDDHDQNSLLSTQPLLGESPLRAAPQTAVISPALPRPLAPDGSCGTFSNLAFLGRDYTTLFTQPRMAVRTLTGCPRIVSPVSTLTR